MLPGSIDNLLRLAGIVISVILAIQPWFIATRSEDPFLFSSWAIFAAGTIAVCILSVLFLFFRPRRGQIVFVGSFLLFFAAVTLSSLNSGFNNSLRGSILLITALLLAVFLRLSIRKQDSLAIAGLIAVSGGAMAIYSLLQLSGYDLLAWNSDFQMVGTFSNPNYLGAFLVVSAVITFGLLDTQAFGRQDRTAFSILLGLQLLALIIGARSGVLLTMAAAIILYFTRFWEVRPGKLLRRTPLVAGLLLAVVATIAQGLVYMATTDYPWQSLNKMPHRYMPAITRLVLWQMGFGIFMDHPVTGLGPGSIAYLMPSYRPPQGSTIGIKPFNDDPHSVIVSLLAELGFFSLWGACGIIAAMFGCYTLRISQDTGSGCQPATSEPMKAETPQPEPAITAQTPAEEAISDDNGQTQPAADASSALFPWGSTMTALLVIFLGYKAGFISAPVFFYLIPGLLALFGIYSF